MDFDRIVCFLFLPFSVIDDPGGSLGLALGCLFGERDRGIGCLLSRWGVLPRLLLRRFGLKGCVSTLALERRLGLRPR